MGRRKIYQIKLEIQEVATRMACTAATPIVAAAAHGAPGTPRTPGSLLPRPQERAPSGCPAREPGSSADCRRRPERHWPACPCRVPWLLGTLETTETDPNLRP